MTPGHGASHGAEGHQPRPPTWSCDTCGAEWPCAPKRTALLDDYRGSPTLLSLYLTSFLVDAMRDLDQAPIGDLLARFLYWPPRPTQPAPAIRPGE